MKDPLSLSTLFANFGNDLAGIDDKKGLLRLIAVNLEPKLAISDILLSILNEDKQTHSVFIHHCNQELMKSSDHSQLSRQKFRLDDGVCNITMASPSPLVVDIAGILLRPEPPGYIAKWYRPSISRMIAVRLRSHGQLLGSLFLFVEKALIGIEDLGMVQHFSYMIGPALRNILSDERMSRQRRDAEALLSLSTDFIKARSRENLFTLLDQRLHELFEFDQSCVALVDKEKKSFRAFLPGRETPAPGPFPYDGGLFEIALAADDTLVIDLDRHLPEQLPEHLEQLHGRGIKEAVMMPLRKDGESFGLLILLCRTKGWFTLQPLNTIRNLCNQLSIAFTNILTQEEILERERDKTLLLSLGKDIGAARNKSDFLASLEGCLRTILPFDELTISPLYADEGLDGGADAIYEALRRCDTPLVYDIDELVFPSPMPPNLRSFRDAGMREMLALPLRENDQSFGALFIYLKKKGHLDSRTLGLIRELCDPISKGVAHLWAYEKIESRLEETHHHKLRLEGENRYLQEQIRAAHGFAEIIGSGSAMQRVFQLISIVGPSDNAVLVLGEAGTGKELVAKAIHNASSRKDKFMINVNCAALAAGPLETELFGEEKGTPAGAIKSRIGKFELANDSTLFLDEIGEMPLELQGRLLQAIHDHRSVRIIATSHRHLRKEVEEGRFRSDLFYRLNVFPIQVPPLRDRKEDVPVLAAHFIEQQAQRSGRKIANISHRALESLMRYDWPGNVRELKHFLERSILTATGPTIKDIALPFETPAERPDTPLNSSIKTLDEMERDHILAVLKRCNHKVGGPDGAARMLRLPATTLHSKLKKMGIK